MTEPLLKVENLNVTFTNYGRTRQVLRDVAFTVAAGERVALIGETGSGKSVTAKAIIGTLPKNAAITSGAIVIDGRDVLSMPRREREALKGTAFSLIMQDPLSSFNPVFKIGTHLDDVMRFADKRDGINSSRAERRNRIAAVLRRVQLADTERVMNAYPSELSGGMRQRVMIAMALASRPKLLIADEPTTALDVTIQGQILDLIKLLQEEEGMSVLFITHDMGVVAEIADRTIVMYRGDEVETGPTEEIFKRGKHPYTRALLSAVPKLGSMKERVLPARFPIIDIKTGESQPVAEVKDTVSGGRTPILSVKDLTTRFDIRSGLFGRKSGAVHAVEKVSFDLAEGETLSLVGESGCGKSTTGRSITRLIEPTSGNVTLDGYEVLKLDKTTLRTMRRSVQMIFQDPFASLDPRMSIGTAIMEPFIEHRLGARQQAREKAADLLEKVGLNPDMMRRFPHEFSGGQRQRIAIARSLMLDPKVIVADEAVSALDVSIKAQVCNLLLDLQQSFNLAYLFISHDMAVVEKMSHRVAVLYLGQIMEMGSRRQVFETPTHDYTRRLLSAVPVADPTIERRIAMIEGEIPNPVRRVGDEPAILAHEEINPGHFIAKSA